MTNHYSPAELEAYLDEALPPEIMASMEHSLRERPELLQQLAQIHQRRDLGLHSVGEIWRRHRITCPTREQLGTFLMNSLDDSATHYIRFHLDVVGCRICQANYTDLQREQEEAADTMQQRRQKYYQSSAGQLKKGKKA
jgi:hypothetical protein